MPILRPVIERLGYSGGLIGWSPARRARLPRPAISGHGAASAKCLAHRRRIRARRTARRCRPPARPHPCACATRTQAGCAAPRRHRRLSSGRHRRTALDLMEQVDSARRRYAAVSAQHLRGLSHARPAGRCAVSGAASRRPGARRSALPAQPGRSSIIDRLELRRRMDCAGRALRIDPITARRAFRAAPRRCCCAANGREGWEEYEWRFRIPGAAPLMPPTDKPQWDGTPLRRTTRCC